MIIESEDKPLRDLVALCQKDERMQLVELVGGSCGGVDDKNAEGSRTDDEVGDDVRLYAIAIAPSPSRRAALLEEWCSHGTAQPPRSSWVTLHAD